MWKHATSFLLAHHSLAITGAAAASTGGIRRVPPSPLFFSIFDAAEVRMRVEDVMPITTGLELKEIEADLQGKKRFDMDAPIGPFGTKEAPVVILLAALVVEERVSMTLCSFGWRKASHMNARSALSISHLRC